ncbi:transketolase [Rhizobium mayense]|uniref:Transketolase n=2 Tax=Rhizobium mayense TaxID=1312184 RepID=A0ABT7JXH7_9HYPH|nr:transketolase [Rhizobium mayense]MDL2401017.1 transketolase [Rhizobium mayense]
MPTDVTSGQPKKFPAPRDPLLRDMANCIRFIAADAVQNAKSGHPGMPMGMADIATVLFRDFMKFDPKNPSWPDRDRFVISNGHGCLLLYSLLYLTGYEGITMDDMRRFRQVDSKTPGHPEYWHIPGIETTTGPLGQGVGNAVGFAIAERVLNATFGDGLQDHFTYVFMGDGCLMEGISQEAISLAGHLKLGKLIAFFDNNAVTIDGPTSLAVSDDQAARFAGSNWHVQEIDGHDTDAIREAIRNAQAVTDRPSLISCKTVIGFGFPTISGTRKAHSDTPGEDEVSGARELLGWNSKPFEIPEPLIDAWRAVGARGEAVRQQWLNRLETSPIPVKIDFERRMHGLLPIQWRTAIAQALDEMSGTDTEMATRKASGLVLEHLTAVMPELIGGSADLTPSNNVKTNSQKEIEPGKFSGSYLHYGVREHGMAAAMNGIALHGGLRPYGGTFLAFSDYCRPSIRLAALMRAPTVFVMTHDSIGLGEDGPTHQPVEQLSALKAIPHLAVFRPADGIETAECWQAILERKEGPSLIALSRQNLPPVRRDHSQGNKSAKGAYVILEADGEEPVVTLLSAGSELHLATEAHEILQEEGVPTRVISMPCRLLFEQQPEEYRRAVLGNSGIRVAVEAGIRDSWDRYIGESGYFVGLTEFGASGKAKDVFEKFGITTEAIVRMAHHGISQHKL